MKSSIRSKLIISFTIIVVISVFLTAVFSRYIQKKFIIERANKIALDEVNYISKEIGDILKLALADLMILRDSPEIKHFVDNNYLESKENIEKIFYNFALHHKIFYQLRLLDNLGKEIIRINYNHDKPVIVKDKNLQVKYNRYYFKQMLKLKKGEVYFSPFDLNIEHHQIEFPYKPVIRIGLPVYDRNGNETYFLILNLDGNIILKLFKNRENKKLGQFLLLDEKGNFLYHPEKEKRFCFMLGKKDNFYKCLPELRAVIKKNDQKVIYFSEGLKHFSIIAFKKFKLNSSINSPQFTILYSISDPDLLVGYNKYFKSFILFTFVILSVCLIIATFIALTLSKPILSLVEATKKVEKGDLSTRINFKSNDEIGMLAHSFNKMTAKLEQYITMLKNSEEKYRNLFKNSQDAVFLIDFEGNIIEINSAGLNLLKIDKTDNNTNLFDFTENFIEELKKLYEITDKEIVVTDLSGEKRICSLKAKITENNIVQGILRDVTEIKKRHEERIKAKRLIEEQIIIAEEKERRNIGQLIHEQLAQDVAFLHLKAQELYQQTKDKNLSQIIETTDKMVSRIRGTVFDLCPVILDEHGLISAIRCYSENFQDKTGIKISFYTNTEEKNIKLSQAGKFYCFRVFKELLNNIFKHASATEVVTTFFIVEGKIRLIVDDDGKGFDTEKTFSKENIKESIGLYTIKKWIEHFNGNFYIESEKGKGTRVVVELGISDD